MYLVMIVALVAGLWSVLAMGRNLHAPEDVAGKWQLAPVSAGEPGQVLTIEQSGRFFQVVFEHGPSLDLKLQGSFSSMLLSNKKWTLNIQDRGPDPDDKLMVLTGPESKQWTAHRTVRTFPADVDSAAESKEAK